MSKKLPAIHLYAQQMREIKRRVEVIDFFLMKGVMRFTNRQLLSQFASSSGKFLS